MIRFTIIILISAACLFCSCKKVIYEDEDTIIQVYKFKSSTDYSNYVPLELSDDKNKITSAPGTISIMPVKLVGDYYLNGSMGVNSAYISLTIEEHNAYDIKPGVDSLYKLLIETDPYIEYYQCNDTRTFMNENGAYGIDTAMINDLIRTDKLEIYFERFK